MGCLSAELLAEISPIKEQTIPLALEGKDVISPSANRIGKTAFRSSNVGED